MEFEYDPKKSESNLEKHGIDFEEAKELWNGYTVQLDARKVIGESRCKILGRIGGEYWAAIYTERGEKIRIISARRMTLKERSVYDRYINMD